ncbi:metal-dependent transcriptional regulator [Lutibacter sp.]|jgi:DtxR family Mn-dependent transcriptional regulator|uniref:metal-dependent transcriptional regulator n=1 Tax=Lutibacter sp. TaxID=1925666 RepID=UPI001A29A342|nr:metal-dependent transcriptional regulator [Lutibacter sp.]MBI9040341.1 metal-dependent transcriptional regulator [Lutibacter sp.]
MFSHSEENYLKVIHNLELTNSKNVSTTLIANELQTKASSVTDMLKKLADKKLVNYEKYKGVTLTKQGEIIALNVVRKHRLWEVFLVDKLNFNWDEVHEVAEQLEHIKSDQLIDRLDAFLNYPTKDPHGDPIPTKNGKMPLDNSILLSDAHADIVYEVSCVKDNSKSLLQFLDKHAITINSEITIVDKFDFDDSMTVKLSNGILLTLSNKVSANVFVNLK